MGQNMHRTLSRSESDRNLLPNQMNIIPPSAAQDNANSCFVCNICLDSAHEPVVTLCGHLYCWHCIYKWLHVQNYSDEVDNVPKCPVCKAQISQSSLVPLYGRGTSPSEPDPKRPQLSMSIPRRPRPLGVHTVPPPNLNLNEQIHTNPFQNPPLMANPYGNYPSSFATMATSNAISPTVGMFGEMVFARMFGPDTGVFPYPYAGNYPLPGNYGPGRIRRQEMQLDKSLNRVSIFLFCCFILCLLLF